MDKNIIQNNIKMVLQYLETHDIDALHVTSFDIYLSEYVPMEDCQRFYLTGFTGSAAEVLCIKGQGVFLLVDGRYYEQADHECDGPLIHIYKRPMNETLMTGMSQILNQYHVKKLAIVSQRMPAGLFEQLKEHYNVECLDQRDINHLIGLEVQRPFNQIYGLDESIVGESTQSKLARIIPKNQAQFISALDSIAWLSNARGFATPYQSQFLAKAFATHTKLYLFVERLEGIDSGLKSKECLEFHLLKDLKTVLQGKNFENISYDSNAVTVQDMMDLEFLFGKDHLKSLPGGIIPFQSIKNQAEMEELTRCFDRSNIAIVNSLNWAISHPDACEKDFYHQTNRFYKEQGAKDLSFQTISAFGANSSVIHFSKPSEDKKLQFGDFILLDSGAHYHSGYATDTTRVTVFGEPQDWQKTIYTLVLIGLIRAESAIFPEGTIGSQIDAFARMAMWSKGYDYAHGTGHGIGVNVHEGGYRLSPISTVALKAGQVGSIEPGIYLPGKGGVRLENTVIVKRHERFEKMLCFKPLTYIGFDSHLIDSSLMNEEEKKYLAAYEAECRRRQTHFR